MISLNKLTKQGAFQNSSPLLTKPVYTGIKEVILGDEFESRRLSSRKSGQSPAKVENRPSISHFKVKSAEKAQDAPHTSPFYSMEPKPIPQIGRASSSQDP